MILNTIRNILFLLTLTMMGCTTKDAQISFSSANYQLKDSVVLFSFDIINSGSGNLIIDSITADCKCTTLSIDSKIAPKGTKIHLRGEIQILPSNGKKNINTLVLIKSNTINMLDTKHLSFTIDGDQVEQTEKII